jgi:hypothetical protein
MPLRSTKLRESLTGLAPAPIDGDTEDTVYIEFLSTTGSMGPSNNLLVEDGVFTGFATARRAELEIATAAADLTVVKTDWCSCALVPIQVQLKYIMPAYRAATSFPKSILLNCSNQAFCLTP